MNDMPPNYPEIPASHSAASERWPPGPVRDQPSMGKVDESERTPLTHHKAMARLASAAAIVSAVAAGFGTLMGLLSPRDGIATGYLVPVAAGIALATVAAAGWHILITAAPRVEKPLGIVGVLACAVGLAGATIGASSWGIATALSGAAAMRTFQADVAAAEEHGLYDAWASAQSESAIIQVVRDSGMQGLAALEIQGWLTGKRGNGPATLVFQTAADRCETAATGMQKEFDHAKLVYSQGRDASQKLHKAAGADTEDFTRYAVEVQGAISDLNAFHLTAMATQCGITRIEISADQASVRRMQAAGDDVTRKVMAAAQEIAARRQIVPVPSYVPIEPRDATRRYAGSAAVGGWVTAVAIDTMPLLFVVLLLLTAGDPQLLRHRQASSVSSRADYDNEANRVRTAAVLPADDKIYTKRPDN